ncbi:hypothetical protein HQ545_02035 [Candidatus Woesearchaeota archaeon]|nr:hypothetical protein [Candidatus Woesearchaeota archaeon]
MLPIMYGRGIAITGPTGSGKTRQAIAEISRALASRLWDGKDDTIIIAKHPRSEPVGKAEMGPYPVLQTDNPDEIAALVTWKTRAVFIDGADSFESPRIVNLYRELIMSNRLAYVIGNNLNWEARSRNHMHKLMALSDEFWSTTLPCIVKGCNNRATRSQHIGDKGQRKCVEHHYPNERFLKDFNQKGWLGMYVGSMFGDKTSEWLGAIGAAKENGIPHHVFKYLGDRRHDGDGNAYNLFGTGNISTNDKRGRIGAVLIEHANHMRQYLQKHPVGDIFIDEGQFIPGLFDFVREYVYKGYRFHITGLLRDFRIQPFGEDIPKLLCMADELRVGHGFCVKCLKYRASDSQRLLVGKDGERTPARYDEPIIRVGGSEAYEARCRGCMEWSDALPKQLYRFEPFDELRG